MESGVDWCDGVFGVGAVGGEEAVHSCYSLADGEFGDGGAERGDYAGDVVAVVEEDIGFGRLC